MQSLHFVGLLTCWHLFSDAAELSQHTAALKHLSNQLSPEIEKLGQIFRVHLVDKILDNQIGIDLGNYHEE